MEALLSMGWPVAALIFSLVALVVLRAPLVKLLARTGKVGKEGWEASDAAQTPPDPKTTALADFMRAYDNKLLLEVEKRIRDDLKAKKLEGAESEAALVRALAGTQAALSFEQLNVQIWAGQVAALEHLNSRPLPAQLEDLKPLYEIGARKYPDFFKAYDFRAWLRFLESWRLIQVTGQNVQITLEGHEYLKWRVETRRAGPFFG